MADMRLRSNITGERFGRLCRVSVPAWPRLAFTNPMNSLLLGESKSFVDEPADEHQLRSMQKPSLASLIVSSVISGQLFCSSK